MQFYKLNNEINFTTTRLIPEGAELLTPNTTDGAYEKHVPVAYQEGDKVHVKVGSVEHPMLDAHWIEWIVIETASGSYQKADLKSGEKPEVVFTCSERVIAAYELCNLHGLWKGEPVVTINSF